MAARIVEVCDMVRADLAAVAGGEATVARTYVPRVDADSTAGRKVFVYPAAYSDELASRGQDVREFRLAVQVTEKYAGGEPTPPDEWVDALVAWVEEKVFLRLGDVRDDDEDRPITQLVAYEAEVTSVYDPDLLAEHGAFESVLTFAFREDADRGD